ncbi:hypothetical protein M0R45_014181 [Rubus argutus]|uniref:Uncharacterized protein n=1 Tax=Rubus argutus TaxID=59490 RepID=A0AAW1XLI2_RUBAR
MSNSANLHPNFYHLTISASSHRRTISSSLLQAGTAPPHHHGNPRASSVRVPTSSDLEPILELSPIPELLTASAALNREPSRSALPPHLPMP